MYRSNFVGFNRTFMELKYIKINFIIFIGLGFNRTFMELKFGARMLTSDQREVLIVPLWN